MRCAKITLPFFTVTLENGGFVCRWPFLNLTASGTAFRCGSVPIAISTNPCKSTGGTSETIFVRASKFGLSKAGAIAAWKPKFRAANCLPDTKTQRSPRYVGNQIASAKLSITDPLPRADSRLSFAPAQARTPSKTIREKGLSYSVALLTLNGDVNIFKFTAYDMARPSLFDRRSSNSLKAGRHGGEAEESAAERITPT